MVITVPFTSVVERAKETKMTIKTLFDKQKDIYRAIEKVITYGATQEARLNSEISEYVVTKASDQFKNC